MINPVTGVITSTSGTIISSGVKAYPNGWYRYHMTYAADSTAARGQVRNNLGGTATFAQWGAQIEPGDAPTSYIPTVASQATRTADDATMTGTNLSDWYNPSQGTFVLEGEYSHIATGVATMLRLDDGTENERILFRIESGTQRFTVIDVGSSQADISRPGVIAGTPFRHAAAYALNSFVASINGGAVATDAAGTLPTVNTLRFRGGATFLYPNGHIRSLRYYPRRLSDAQVRALSA